LITPHSGRDRYWFKPGRTSPNSGGGPADFSVSGGLRRYFEASAFGYGGGASDKYPSLFIAGISRPGPVIQAILDGVNITGVTLIELDAKMDHGPILAQAEYKLDGTETPDDLYPILMELGVDLLMQISRLI